MLSDNLDKLDKGPEYKHSGPVPGMSAEQVWERMREYCMYPCHQNAEGLCAFAACPLLKNQEEAKP